MNRGDIQLTVKLAFHLPRDLQFELREYGIVQTGNYLVCRNKLDLSKYNNISEWCEARSQRLKIKGNMSRPISANKITYDVSTSYNAITHVIYSFVSNKMICVNIYQDHVNYIVYNSLINSRGNRRIFSQNTKKNKIDISCNIQALVEE